VGQKLEPVCTTGEATQAWFGTVGQGIAGKARLGAAGHGLATQAWFGTVGQGIAGRTQGDQNEQQI